MTAAETDAAVELTAEHAISRLTFGTTPDVRAAVAAVGLDGWIEDQLGRTTSDPTVEDRLGSFRLLQLSRKDANAITRHNSTIVREELTHVTFLRAVFSQSQLLEVMMQVWTDHFSIALMDNVLREHLSIDHLDRVIRPHALGRFDDLLRATAHSPGMLEYLDNAYSNPYAPSGLNENYGRELLELHSTGIRPDGTQLHTEADVRSVAAIMAGWSLVRDTSSPSYTDFLYRSDYHRDDVVTVFDGDFSTDGTVQKDSGDALLTYLAHHPWTARHVAYKLVRHFVDDDPDESLVASTAEVFTANETAIVPTLRHIFASPEFAAAAGLKFRRPFTCLAAALRGLGASLPDDPQSPGAAALLTRLSELGHVPFEWPQPDGYPDTADAWRSSNGLLIRWSFGAEVASNALTAGSGTGHVSVEVDALRGEATTAGELVDVLSTRFGLGLLEAETRDLLLDGIGASEATDIADVTDTGVSDLASYLLAHPLFQVR